MLPISKVQDLISRHSRLEKELSSQEIDKKTFAEKSKEYSDLNDIIKEATSYFNFQKNKEELEKLINDNNSDKEMKDLAINELYELEKNFHMERMAAKLMRVRKYFLEKLSHIIRHNMKQDPNIGIFFFLINRIM